MSTTARHEQASSDGLVAWAHDVRHEGVVTYRMGRQGRLLVAEWPDLARLTCDERGRHPRLTPSAGATPGALAKLQGVVKALVGDLRGDVGLHASAVAMGSRAAILLGDSGAGKSTAAAELCLRHEGRLLADDVALLEKQRGIVWVAPSEDHHYLSQDSGDALGVRLPDARLGEREKAALRPACVATRPYRLVLVVSLCFDDALDGTPASTVTRRMGGAEAARCILGAMFRFDMRDRRNELDRVTCIYEQAVFVEIARPRSAPDATAAILQALRAGRPDGQ